MLPSSVSLWRRLLCLADLYGAAEYDFPEIKGAEVAIIAGESIAAYSRQVLESK